MSADTAGVNGEALNAGQEVVRADGTRGQIISSAGRLIVSYRVGSGVTAYWTMSEELSEWSKA